MRTLFWEGFVLGLLVGAGLVLASPWLVAQVGHLRAPSVELHPAVAVQNVTLRLTNTDSFEWKQVELILNAHTSNEGYTFHLPRLPAGAQVELALTSFMARNKQPFDPHTTKAFLLSLQAKTPQGWGTWSGRID